MKTFTEVPHTFPQEEPEREDRIYEEAIVDAHGDEEVIISWYYYLEEKLDFPFTAAVQVHSLGRSRQTIRVEMQAMGPVSRCGYWQMWVLGSPSEQEGNTLYPLLPFRHRGGGRRPGAPASACRLELLAAQSAR